jgi:hypothetical protein
MRFSQDFGCIPHYIFVVGVCQVVKFKMGVGKKTAAAQDSLYAIFSGHSVGDFVVRFKIGVGKKAAAAQDSLYAIFSRHSVGDFVVSHQLDQFNAMQGLCAVC